MLRVHLKGKIKLLNAQFEWKIDLFCQQFEQLNKFNVMRPHGWATHSGFIFGMKFRLDWKNSFLAHWMSTTIHSIYSIQCHYSNYNDTINLNLDKYIMQTLNRFCDNIRGANKPKMSCKQSSIPNKYRPLLQINKATALREPWPSSRKVLPVCGCIGLNYTPAQTESPKSLFRWKQLARSNSADFMFFKGHSVHTECPFLVGILFPRSSIPAPAPSFSNSAACKPLLHGDGHRIITKHNITYNESSIECLY